VGQLPSKFLLCRPPKTFLGPQIMAGCAPDTSIILVAACVGFIVVGIGIKNVVVFFLFLIFINKQEPCYRREDRAMPLYISIRIEFYNGIARLLCHSTHFLLVFVYRLQ